MKNIVIVLTGCFTLGFIVGIYFIGTPVFIMPDMADIKKGFDDKAEVVLPLSADEIRFNKRPQEWLKNPFSLPKEVGFSGDIAIEAILISPLESRVMIAGETYRENDILGAYRIKKISHDYIVLTEGAKDLIIKLKKGD